MYSNCTDANGCKATKALQLLGLKQLTPTVETITDYNCDTKYVNLVGQVKEVLRLILELV
jgi:hypothetical protein